MVEFRSFLFLLLVFLKIPSPLLANFINVFGHRLLYFFKFLIEAEKLRRGQLMQ